MNATILRALFEDARQQVLDNKVFRLLIILTGIPILFTLIVGFREDHISILFGLRQVAYADILSAFGAKGVLDAPDLNVRFIQGVQELMVSVFVGTFGMMLCIAATAFFAPRILEKGAADTLFSKPVSRMTILLSRYFAGILFVAFISSLLVLGMYFGFLTSSGYNDPGFLWGALTLVYLYAMMHSFSIAVAVFTRSSTAAILLTLFLFMLCGGIHGGWQTYKYFQEQEQVAQLRALSASDEDEDGEADESSAIVEILTTALEAAHYVLPKTSDADMITRKLRRAVTERAPIVATDDGDFVLKEDPEGFVLEEDSADDFEGSGVRWVATDEEGTVKGRISVRRYLRPEVERTVGSKTRVRQQTSKDAADQLEESLQGDAQDLEVLNEQLSDVRVLNVTWKSDGGAWGHSRLFLHFDKWMYEFDIELAQGFLNDMQDLRLRRRFLYQGNVVLGQIAGMTPDRWYDQVFTWDAELKYNIFFSIGSSVAFIVAMLTLAWLRLRAIDF